MVKTAQAEAIGAKIKDSAIKAAKMGRKVDTFGTSPARRPLSDHAYDSNHK
jgi:hypothetical protein